MIEQATRMRVFVAIVSLLVASAAAAHTPPPSFGSDLDLRFEAAAPNRVQSFSVFTRTNAFAELTRIELPLSSIADELAQHFAVNEKLASGPRRFTLQSKSSEWSDLGAKTWWGKENKAAPFVEPATGLVGFRNRWYDPSTGTWLTPDAESYSAGSSNLYGGFNGDPVNNADPDGNELVSLLAYTAWAGLNSAIDTGIDYGFHRWLGEGEFNWGKSFGTNFAVNFATAGIAGKVAKLRYLQHLKNPIVRRAAAEGIEYAADVAVTGTIEKFAYGQSYGEAYGSAAVGGGIGRGVTYGLRRGARWLREATAFDFDLRGGSDAIFSDLAPKITPGMYERQRAKSVETTALTRFYPPNRGFAGATERQFLMPGEVIDRYGGSGVSRFFSPAGTPDWARSLPPGTTAQRLRRFEVLKPFEVQRGEVAPWIWGLGGGTQFDSPVKLEVLLKRGILKELP